jgi:hypothetical protein
MQTRYAARSPEQLANSCSVRWQSPTHSLELAPGAQAPITWSQMAPQPGTCCAPPESFELPTREPSVEDSLPPQPTIIAAIKSTASKAFVGRIMPGCLAVYVPRAVADERSPPATQSSVLRSCYAVEFSRRRESVDGNERQRNGHAAKLHQLAQQGCHRRRDGRVMGSNRREVDQLANPTLQPDPSAALLFRAIERPGPDLVVDWPYQLIT